MTTETDSPTLEERAKFYLNNSISLVGYEDTLSTIVGDSHHAERNPQDAEDAVRNLAISFEEGVRRNMRNSREHGYHPTKAFENAVQSDWPNWVVRRIAEQEHTTFTGGFPQDRTDEEQEYIEYLEDEYDVPR